MAETTTTTTSTSTASTDAAPVKTPVTFVVSGLEKLEGENKEGKEPEKEVKTIKPLTAGEVMNFKITKKLDGFFTGFDVTTPEEQEKRKKRAEKYGISVYNPQFELEKIDEDEFERREQRKQKYGVQTDKDVFMDEDVHENEKEDLSVKLDLKAPKRFDCIHVFGTKLFADVWTNDSVLKFFAEFGPVHVEWINGSQCNVLFGDAFSAKRALQALSKPMPDAPTYSDEELKDAGVSAHELPFLMWRVTAVSRPGSTLLLRIATEADKKRYVPNNEKRLAQYAKVFGKRYRPPPAQAKPKPPPKTISLQAIRSGEGAVRKETVGRALRKASPYDKPDSAESTREKIMAPVVLDDEEKERRQKRGSRFGTASSSDQTQTDGHEHDGQQQSTSMALDSNAHASSSDHDATSAQVSAPVLDTDGDVDVDVDLSAGVRL